MTNEAPLTVKEAARRSNMSVPWWRKKIRDREVKHLRIGRKVLIPKDTIRELFKTCTVEPRKS
jgi:excisionase family DNA binding protein